ncbi:MAG: Rab family GTPase [Candidatus Helarchaeota archaeon]
MEEENSDSFNIRLIKNKLKRTEKLLKLREKKIESQRIINEKLQKKIERLENKIKKLQGHLLQFISKDEQPIISKPTLYKLKLVLLGDNAVGKTSFIKRFAYKKFDTEYKPTIGAEITKMKFKFKENNIIDLMAWDIAGQSSYEQLAKNFIQGADLAVLIYDITRLKTFENIKRWYQMLMNISNVSKRKVTALIIGNKSDLEEKRVITIKNAIELSRSIDVPFIETSAKEDQNIKDALIMLIADYLQISLI